MSIALSGSLVITGSIFATQGITGSFSGSATSASYAETLQGLGSASFAPAATFNTVSQSFATTSGSAASRLNIIETSYATTGSNNFTAPQYISQASNAISFTSTASLYTDGGLRVSKDSFVSGTAYFNNVVVYGTSSIQYITSSQVNFGTNIITVNTDTPAVRFGGLAVFDSGSTQLTGSMLWDSEKNHWVYSNPSGSTYSGGMLISGPRSAALGDEVGTTSCALMMGQGGDHITSSAIFSYGNATCFYGQSFISSSGGAYFASCVGIGTATPATPLHIVTAGLPAIRLTLGSEARCHNINGVNLGRDLQVLPFRHFSVQTGNGIAEGQIVLNAYEDFIVGTGASYTPRLTITPTGIACFACQICTTTLRATSVDISAGSSAAFSFGVDQQSTFAFGSTNGKRVGIIRDSTCADNGLQFGYDVVDKTGIIAGSATAAGVGIDFYTYNGSAWANRMRITKDGIVGIGTTTPGYTLDVNGTGRFSSGTIFNTGGRIIDAYFAGGPVGGNNALMTYYTVPSTAKTILVIVQGNYRAGVANNHNGYNQALFMMSGCRIQNQFVVPDTSQGQQSFCISYSGGNIYVCNNTGMANTQSGDTYFIVYG